ncbi:hypothetical protein AB8A21_40380 [Streptomyces sp. BF23-18]
MPRRAVSGQLQGPWLRACPADHVTTRFDKRTYVFHGTVTLASIRLWLRS